MFKDFKPEIKTLLIVALIAVVLSVVSILLLRNDVRNLVSHTPNPFPNPQNDQTVLDTSGWQTYRNDEFGFEVKYPISFTVASTGLSDEQKRLEKGENISGTVAPSFDTVHFSDQKNEPIISIAIFHPSEEDLSKKSYGEGSLHIYGPCDLRWGFEPSNIEEKNMLGHSMLIVQGNYTVPELGQALMCVYLKNREANLIVMDSENFSLLNQILATFRFVE